MKTSTTDWFVQQFLGFATWLFLVLPFVRRIEGHLPRGQHLYVCNHVSLLDTLVLGGLFWSRRRTPILVLGDRGTWRASRIRRWLSARVGFLIDRGTESRATLVALGEFAGRSADYQLIVFPEGTRGDGRTVGPCQPGIALIARKANVPIVPIALSNMQAVSTKNGRFHPVRGFRKVTIRIGDEFRANPADRSRFLEEVRTRIAELLDR